MHRNAYYEQPFVVGRCQLADGIQVAATTLSGWERGVATPDIDTLFAICNFLQVSLSDMCGVISEENNYPVSTEEKKLLLDFQKLNVNGKDKLLERMEELVLLGYTVLK